MKIGALYAPTAPGAAFYLWGDQADLVESLVNDGCGIGGDELTGTPVDIELLDGESNATVMKTKIDQLVASGARMIVGAAPSDVMGASITASINSGYDVIYSGITFSGPNGIGCTQAQLDNPAVTKSNVPVFPPACFNHKGRVFRTALVTADRGAALGKYARAVVPSLTVASVLRKNDATAAMANAAGNAWAAGGGTTGPVVNHAPGAVKADFKAVIPTLVANDPEVILWALPNEPEIVQFMEAWYELSVDPSFTKPSHFDTARIFASAGVAGVTLSSATANARTYFAGRVDGQNAHWDENSEAYQRWYDAWTDFYPDEVDPVVTHRLSAFDSLMIFALAQTGVPLDSTMDELTAKMYEVINPPGDVYYPDQYAEARAAILRGDDIDYEGYIHMLDPLTGSTDLATFVNGAWRMNAAGSFEFLGVVSEANWVPH